MNNFKFLPSTVGSGWVGAYIAIDEYLVPRDLEGSGEICLSFDCQDAAEFSEAVDKLVGQLNELKLVAHRKFQAAK